MQTITKRKFTESFRAEAVRMVLDEQQSIAEVVSALAWPEPG